MVLLKPFLLKNTVWNWGTPLNTADMSVSVSHPEHPIFEGLTLSDGELQLFSQVNTNAVTAISEWSISDPDLNIQTLAAPTSHPTATSIAELPAGTDCNGTILPQRMIMIGVSEYSTTHLTSDGKKLIENAILYQLGIPILLTVDTTVTSHDKSKNHIFIHEGKLYIQTDSALYDAMGRCIKR